MKDPMQLTDRQRAAYISAAFALIFLLMLCVAAFAIARPFLPPLAWGMILAIATWPALSWLRRRFGGRRTLAAAAMTLLLAVVLLGPIGVLGAAMTGNVATLGERLREAIDSGLTPPAFLADIPLIGDDLTRQWSDMTADGELTAEARQLLRSGVQWLLRVGAAIGGGVAQIALSIFCAFFFYRDGEAALRRVRDVLAHVAGDRAERLLQVAFFTLKGVVYGVIGAALAQSTLAAFGFWLAGVPAPFLLGLMTGCLGLIPGGPTLIWLPAAIWLFRTGEVAWSAFVLAWGGLLVSNIDSVIRPYFVSRGGAMPMLVVLIGILGGALAFGFVGVFIGPTILSILFALMREWSPSEPAHPSPGEARPPTPT